MKRQYLIIMISCIALPIVLLIILYTCEFFTSTPDAYEWEPVTEEIPKQTPAAKPEQVKPASTRQPEAKTPAPKKEKPPLLEDTFEYLTEYDGHTYFIAKIRLEWKEAEEICEEHGGHLVTITSKQENSAIIEAIKAKQIKEDIWIGLSDHKAEGVWKWVTGEKRTFTYWDAMQPDNWKGPPGYEDYRGEDYVFIWQPPRAKLPYHWNDALKDSSTIFILEIEPR